MFTKAQGRLSFIVPMTLLLASELTSLLSLQFLALNNTAWPWSFLTVLHHGFALEVGLAALMTLPVALIGWGFWKGGFSRYLAGIGLGVATILLLAFVLGLLVNQWLDGGTPMDFTQTITFLRSLTSDHIALRQFFGSELAALAIVCLLPGFLFFERLRPANKVLGNAHFASGLEIKKAQFFEQKQESIIIGKKSGLPLYANGFEHVLVFAPSGSGKTRSIAIPNLFHYPWSVVCNDIKFTLFETTSGYRKNILGHECYCFAPARAGGVTHRFNPLSFISEDVEQRMTDIQRIAHILIPDNPKDPIWAQASRKLFKTMMLYLLDSPGHPTTLGEINRLVKQQNFNSWLQDKLDNTEHYDAEFYRNGYSYISNHEKTRQSILESFSGYFELFDDPVVDAATNASDFDLRDLRRKKMTIYVGFTDEDMERLAPLLTLFWQQLISAMISKIPNPKEEPYPLLCLIDEFSSLGRIERLRRALKLLREYRVRCILMFQYIAQTYERYSHDEARAFTNIKTKVAYTTEDLNDAEFISKMLGTRTKRVVSRSTSNQHHGTSDSKSISYQAIPLLRPDELMKLPPRIALIIRSGFAPIKARQYIWYRENAMKHLQKAPTDVPKQTITRSPFVRSPEILREKHPKKVSCLD